MSMSDNDGEISDALGTDITEEDQHVVLVVNELRACHSHLFSGDQDTPTTYSLAADLIESQAAELHMLRERLWQS